MTNLFAELSERAQALAPQERAALAEILLVSLPEDGDEDVESAWANEIRLRMAEVESGAVQTISAEDVFAEARRLLG